MELVGRVVSHYQFLEKLGAGGMGDIYKAHDARLNRFVAVKVLSSANAGDPERRRRFIQEAQAASGLNHPNIITIHDIVNEPEGDYMVMEFVSGKTLVDLIPKGGLRAPQALKYGVQMADALSAAHAAGIVHRDLKPGNVMVTDSGLVKVLDFGLAKLTDRGPASSIGDNTQTIAEAPLTVEGSIIGTVSYMSPEQAQGRKVDTRSDIFSFGVVFYEMLTGARAFSGDSALSTLSAILRDEHKPMIEIAPDVPPQLELLITRCLRKNPDERWQSMKDVLAALGALKHESDSGQLYRSRIQAVEMAPRTRQRWPRRRKRSRPRPLIVGLVVLVLLIAGGAVGGWWWMKHRAVPPLIPCPWLCRCRFPPLRWWCRRRSRLLPTEAVLNNDSIIEMVTSKVPTSVILSQIRAASKTDFVLTSAEVIRLSKAGVSGTADRSDARSEEDSRCPPTEDQYRRRPRRSPPRSRLPTPAPAVAPPVSQQPPNNAKATTAPPPPPPPKPAAGGVAVNVPDAMPFSIKLAEDVPADAEEGRVLRFTAVDGLKIGDTVVIAKGASVTGSIVEAGKKKVFGMGGKMTFRLAQADAVDGKKLNVRAEPSRGKDVQASHRFGREGQNQRDRRRRRQPIRRLHRRRPGSFSPQVRSLLKAGCARILAASQTFRAALASRGCFRPLRPASSKNSLASGTLDTPSDSTIARFISTSRSTRHRAISVSTASNSGHSPSAAAASKRMSSFVEVRNRATNGIDPRASIPSSERKTCPITAGSLSPACALTRSIRMLSCPGSCPMARAASPRTRNSGSASASARCRRIVSRGSEHATSASAQAPRRARRGIGASTPHRLQSARARSPEDTLPDPRAPDPSAP